MANRVRAQVSRIVGEVAHQPTVDVGDVVGALLVTRAQHRLDRLVDVRLTLFVEDDRGRWDAPTRGRIAATLRHDATAVVHGQARTEHLAEQRWLAWFPRPFGPHHAINVASPVTDWVARRDPDVSLVRVHLAARSWRAELLQAVGLLARTAWGRRRIDHWVARGGRFDDDGVRWAALVEATDGGQQPVRAWAWGSGPQAAATRVQARLATSDGAPGSAGGPDAGHEATWLPAPRFDAEQARAVLDDLAGAGVLRWSVADPGTT